MDKETQISSFVGSMIGCAVGDAIGELAFKYFPEEILYPVICRKDPLEYTDDTAMAIGLAESICNDADVIPDTLGNIFKANFEKEPARGYAGGPPSIFYLVDKGVSYFAAASKLYGGEGSYGNGAAMRIAPLALFYSSADALLVEKAALSAMVTHVHPFGVEGAVILAKAISMAVNCRRQGFVKVDEFISGLQTVVKTVEFREKLSMIEEVISEGITAEEAARRLGNKVTALGSVPFAIYCFLKNINSFESCLLYAVLSGGDKDTLGAMACSIAGAFLGVEEIPESWSAKVENREYIISLATQLADMSKGTASG